MRRDDEREIERRAEARVVEWLRHVDATQGGTYKARAVADAIERGEHRKDRT